MEIDYNYFERAVCANNTLIVKQLIKTIVKLNKNYVDILRLWGTALKIGNMEIIKVFIKEFPHLLQFICETDNIQLFRQFVIIDQTELSRKKINSESLMHICAKFNSVEICKCLIGNGIVVNQVNEFYETPLHIACENSNFDIVKILCDVNNIDLCMTDCYNRTPFIVACQKNANFLIMRHLLSHDNYADPNAQDLAGNTGFDIACRYNAEFIVNWLCNLKLDIIDVNVNNPNVELLMIKSPDLFCNLKK